MSDVNIDEQTQRAHALRQAGRLDESLLVAREGVKLAPKDANGWWQLALSQSKRDGSQAALESFKKVVQFAPGFFNGWVNLGLAHHGLGQYPFAIQAFEKALALDGDRPEVLRLLEEALRGHDAEGTRAKRLELLTLYEHSEALPEDSHFQLGYLQLRAGEHLVASQTFERYLDAYGTAGPALFNLALCYEGLGRVADASDCFAVYEQAEELDETLLRNRTRVRDRLATLRQAVPNPQAALFPQEDWFRFYVGPISMLAAGGPLDLDDAKSVQRAKQALLREIELEDGRVEWMPGMSLDKSTALAAVEELNTPARHAHLFVRECPGLEGFLTRGEVLYFLEAKDYDEEPFLPHQAPQDALEYLSPKFAAQFDLALSRALERQRLPLVDALLAGRRLVLPQHQEICFEGAKRVVTRIAEPVLKLPALTEKRQVSLKDIETILAKDGLGALLKRLPADFHETLGQVCGALRSLSVAYWNKEQDAEQAMAILQLGKPFASKSAGLLHQYEEDEAFLKNVIKRERQHETRLALGDTKLSITKEGVRFGADHLAPSDIIGIRAGIKRTGDRPATFTFTVDFFGRGNKPDVVMVWSASKDVEDQKKRWNSLLEASFAYVIPTLTTNLIADLNRGERLHIGPLVLFSEGIIFELKGWFSTKQHVALWGRLHAEMKNGTVTVTDMTNTKATASLPVDGFYNAMVLHTLIDLMKASQ